MAFTRSRTAEGERERLARIQEEFERGFRALGRLGPAVTVFGSARFKEGHRYYELAREVGRELARAGFVTITGGGVRADFSLGEQATIVTPVIVSASKERQRRTESSVTIDAINGAVILFALILARIIGGEKTAE